MSQSAGSGTSNSQRSRGLGKLSMSNDGFIARSFGSLFESDLPLFPFLRQMRRHAWSHRHFVRAGLAMEAAQTIAFAAQPYHPWSFSLKGIFQAVLFSMFPIYDPDHIDAGWEVTAGFVVAALCLELVVMTIIALGVLPLGDDGALLLPTAAAKIAANGANAIGGWLFVPILSISSSFFFCDPTETHSAWFGSDLECTGSTGLAMRIVAVVTAVLGGLMAFFVRTMMFESNPTDDSHPHARAHAKIDVLLLAHRAAAVTLSHYFISTGQMLLFTPYIAITSLLIIIAVVIVVPYLHRATQYVVVWAHMLAALVAIVAGISRSGEDHLGRVDRDRAEWWEFVQENHIDTAFCLGVALPLSLVLARVVYLARFSAAFRRDFELLSSEGKLHSSRSLFPANLPSSDQMAKHDYVGLINELAASDDDDDDLKAASVDADDAQNKERDDWHFTTTVVDTVLMTTDVELANRFLRFFSDFTGLTPTSHMLSFAGRVFVRGRLRFQFDGTVGVSFVQFLMFQAKRIHFAHAELQRMRTRPMGLRARFESFAMNTQAESLLQITRKHKGRQSSDKVKRHHRDVLQAIADFWTLLSSEDCDTNSLGVATSAVITNREACAGLYSRLLSHNPQNVEYICLYAKFCEDVLNNDDATQQTVQSLSEVIEMRAMHATRGARANAGADTTTPLPLNAASESNIQSNANMSMRVNSVRLQSLGFTFVVCATALTVLLLAVFFEHARENTCEATYYAGRLRSVAASSSTSLQTLPSAIDAGNATVIAAIQRQLTAASSDMIHLRNSLFNDKHRPAAPEHFSFRSAAVFGSPGSSETIVSLWALVGLVAESMRSVAATANVTRASHEFLQLERALDTDMAFALNRTVAMYRLDADYRDFVMAASSASLLVFIAICMVVTFTQLVSNVHAVSRVKSEILSLFGYIRRERLQSLLVASKKASMEFDMFIGQEDKDKAEQLIRQREELDVARMNDVGGSGMGGHGDVINDMGDAEESADPDDGATQQNALAGAIAGGGDEGERAGLAMGIDDDEDVFPTNAVQPSVTFIVLIASVVALSLALVSFFPSLTWEQRRTHTKRLLDARRYANRGLADDVLTVQKAIATGDWTSHSALRALPVTSYGRFIRGELVSTPTVGDVDLRSALVLNRKLEGLERLLTIAATLATSVPLTASFATANATVTADPVTLLDPSWRAGRPQEETDWRFDVSVIDPLSPYPYRRLPVLRGRAADLARPAHERLSLAVNLATSDLVDALVASSSRQLSELIERAVVSVRRADQAQQQGLLIGIVALLGAIALPGIVMLLRREFLVAAKIRITKVVGAMVSVALLATLGAVALAAVLLSMDVNARDSTTGVQSGAAACVEYHRRLTALRRGALHLAMRDADPVWIARMLNAASAPPQDRDGSSARDAYRPVIGLLRPAPVGVRYGIDPVAFTDFAPPAVATFDTVAASVESAARLVVASLAPNQTVVNATEFASTFGGWDFSKDQEAVPHWLSLYDPTLDVMTHAATTVRYDPTQLNAATLGTASPTTQQLDAAITADTLASPQVIRSAATAVAIEQAAGAWPGVRDSFAFDGVKASAVVSAMHRLGQYANEAADLAAALSVRLRIALNSATSRRQVEAAEHVLGTFDVRVESWVHDKTAAEDRNVRSADSLARGLVGLSCVAALSMLVSLFASVIRSSAEPSDTDEQSEEANAADAPASAAPNDETATQATQKRQSRRASKLESRDQASLGQVLEPAVMTLVVLCIVAVCAGFVYRDFDIAKPTAPLLVSATTREYVTAAAAGYARRMAGASEMDRAMARRDLRRLVQEARVGLDKLYFMRGDRLVGLGQDDTQDSLLYSVRTTASALQDFVDTHAQCSGSSSDSTAYLLGVPSDVTSAGADALALGLSAAYDVVFLAELRALLTAEVSADITSHANTIVLLAPPLLRALEASSAQYRAYALDQRKGGARDIAICAAAIIVATLLYCTVVMVRFVDGMQSVEASARMMLELIPPAVIDATPAISAYLESGSDGTGDDTAANSESQITENVSNMSTLPVIAIDPQGKIIKFTQAAERAFGYTAAEVTGLNLNVLMPPDIATNHDGFLSRYRRTKQKHVIDTTRRSRAMRKSGEVFPVEISVKELQVGPNAEADMVYIGFVRDMTTTVQLSLQGALNRYVLLMSDAAILAIDDRGTIILASRRMTDLFGFESHELLRENVRMLMPSDVAMQHDGYLARYKQTGVRHIIGNRNVVTAQKKNGEVFRIAITVREIKSEEYGESSTYVATITDVTLEEEQQAQSVIHDLISDLSPTPIIAITDDGTIVKFSRAASRLFGYQSEEVLADRLNIQLLIPERYGVDHTEYIKSYRARDGKDSRVVGVTRNVLARKRNGTEFPIELTVREVKNEGVSPIFLAFVQDASEKVEATTATAITDGAVENSLIPLIAITTQGVVTRFNPAATGTFGYTAEEVIGRNIKMLMPRKIADKHDGFLSRYLETRVRNVIDRTRHVLGRCKDGQRVPLELNIREVAATETTPASYIGYARDITVERQARRQYLINDLVSELSTVPIIGIDGGGTVLSFSRAAEDVFGYHAMEVVGSNIKMLMPKETATNHDGYLSRYHRTKVKSVIDTTRYLYGIRKDGKPIPLELSVREIADPKGGPSSFVGFARETTNDGALDAASRLADTIRDVSTVPLVEVNTDGTIRYVNQALLTEFRYNEKSELLGKNIRMLTPDEIAPNHDGFMRKYLEGNGAGIVGSTRRVPGKRKDGTIVTLELSLGEFKSADTDRHFFVGYLLNVSAQIELEEANSTVNKITNMSMTPIIAIDASGTVITFNAAATRTFGYDPDEVRGQNVKMLMPAHIAEKHDGYLRTYAKTGLKTVIDQVIRQTGLQKSGRNFPLELRVKEIQGSSSEAAAQSTAIGKGDKRQQATADASSNLYVGYARDITEDLALERETRLFNIVLDLSAVPIIVITRLGIVKSMNPVGLALFGYTDEEVVGKNIKMLMPKKIAVNHDRYLKAYIATGEKRVIDTTRRVDAKRKDGSQFPAEISVREILSQSGRPEDTIYAGFLHDLTEQVEVERESKINEAISDLSLFPLIVMTAHGVVQKFSKSAERVFGTSSAEMVGKNIKVLMPTETAEKHDGFLAAFRERSDIIGTVVRRTVRAKRMNGDEFLGRITVRALLSNDGFKDFMLLIGYLEDITSKEEFERNVRITEGAIKLAAVPVIELETGGIVRSFNHAAAACFGYSPEEVVGQNIKMLMPSHIAVNHDGYLSRYLETGVKRVIDTRRQVTGKRKDGREFPALVSVSEIKSENTHFYVGYVEDRTQLLALEESRAINEAALNASADPFIMIDEEGKVELVNPAVEKLFGYSSAEVVGQNISMLVAEPHKSKHDSYLARYKETGTGKMVNTTTKGMKGLRKDGSTLTVDVCIREENVSGRKLFIGSFKEVGSLMKKQAERAIALMAEKGCVSPLVAIDDVGIIMRVNEAAVNIFGYSSPSDLIGNNVKMLMPLDMASRHDGILRRYKETGVKHVIDTRRQVTGKRRNGTAVEVILVVREIKVDITETNPELDFSLMDSNVGKKTIYVAAIEDVAASNMLQLAGVLNDAVMQLLPAPVVTIDEMGKILSFNVAAENTFEFTSKQVIGRNVNILMPPEYSGKHDGFLQRYRETGVKHVIDSTRDVIGETKSGLPIRMSLRVREVRRPRRDGSSRKTSKVSARGGGDGAAAADDSGMESVFIGFIKVHSVGTAP